MFTLERNNNRPKSSDSNLIGEVDEKIEAMMDLLIDMLEAYYSESEQTAKMKMRFELEISELKERLKIKEEIFKKELSRV